MLDEVNARMKPLFDESDDSLHPPVGVDREARGAVPWLVTGAEYRWLGVYLVEGGSEGHRVRIAMVMHHDDSEESHVVPPGLGVSRVELPHNVCPVCKVHDPLVVALHTWVALVQRPADPLVEDRLYTDVLDEGLPGSPHDDRDQSSTMVCRACRHADRAAAFWSTRARACAR